MSSESRVVFEGHRFRVERRDVRGRDGQPRSHDIVVHSGAAVVLPLLEDGRIVLIRNNRPAVGEELLELPAGTIDPPESPEACAARELQEETGYVAQRLEKLGAFYSTPGFCTELMHAYLATGLQAGPTQHETGEQIRVVPTPYDEALGDLRTGRIRDAKTIAALLLYDRFKRTSGGAP